MLITQSMTDALNQQIGNEFGASLQYVAIAAHLASDSLPELAAHFHHQAEEERDHALRFVKFLVDAGAHVEIPAVAAPRSEFKNAEEAVQHSLDQEKLVTDQIKQLVDLAHQESDHITDNFLAWFLTEQLEEVSSMENLLKMVQRAGDTNLLFVEDHLARSRMATAPKDSSAERNP